jgi:large subunit ribosomal protein L18
MSSGPRYRIKPRRRRQGITDYRKRLALIKSGKPRIIVRKSLKHMRVQFIEYNEQGDRVLVSALGSDLINEYKWNHATSTTPAAYLIGLLAGKRAKDAGINEGVFDIGRQVPVKGSKVFAAIKGVHDAGIECYAAEEKLPSEERILGKHLKDKTISSDAKALKDKLTGGK